MKIIARFLACLVGVMAAPAHAATVFYISVFSVPQSSYLPPDTGTSRTFEKAIAAATDLRLVVTLEAGGIDTTASSSSGTISNGIDAFFTDTANIVGNTGGTFQDTLWHITGYFDVTQTANTFSTSGNNDGLRLAVGGITVFDIQGGGVQTTNVDLPIGPQSFDMYYWNGATSGLYNFNVNGLQALAAVSAPEPGKPALVAIGLSLLGLRRRRTRCQN